MANPVCVVTGVGPGLGASLVRRFAAGGHPVAMLARSTDTSAELEQSVPGARAIACDVGDRESVHEAMALVRRELGPIGVLCQNAGNAVFGSVDDLTDEVFEAAWKVNTLGLFHCAKAVLPDLRAAGGGSILVTGATAALRGGARFAAFASAKAAQRSLAQSLARQLGPENIHVAYVIVDGVIDMPTTRRFFPDHPDEFYLRPDAIAETYWHLARQDRSAWTFEVDVRPFGEKW
jgi:NAD(P)-dependent dehydrogenase (short-subunit alcohol dehydrogenase family)